MPLREMQTGRPQRQPALVRYGLSALGVIGAAVLTAALPDLLAPIRLFFFWVAVAGAALLGVRTAIFATVLCALLIPVAAFAPAGSFSMAGKDPLRLALFVLFAGLLGVAIGLVRTAQQRAADLGEWFATTLSSIGDAVIATDAVGRIAFMNKVAERLTCWRAEEAHGVELTTVFRVIDERTRQPVRSPVQKVLEERQVVQLANHTILIARDGREVAVEDTAAPIVTASGATVGAVLVFHDVGERRRLLHERSAALADLQTSELTYRSLAEVSAAPQAVWTATPAGEIQWSERWLDITGQTREEVESGGGLDVVAAADAERTSSRWKYALATTTPYEDEIRVRVKSGRYRWFAIRGVPVVREREVVRWVGVIADVHDRVQRQRDAEFINRATEVLGSSLDYEKTLRTLARLCVPELADWCTIDVARENEPYLRVAVEHVDPDKVRLAFEMDATHRPPPEVDPIFHVIASGRSRLLEEISDELLIRATRDAAHLELARSLGLRSSMIVPMIARGRAVGALTVVSAESGRRYSQEDLPLLEELARRAGMALDQARLYKEAQSANRAKDDFLATLSHELRTPLTTILGWANMLQIGELDPDTAKLAIDSIVRSAKAQGTLIDELLDLSRIIAGKLEIERASVELGGIVRDVVMSALPSAQAKRVALSFDHPPQPIFVRGDARRLTQIVWNVLGNAVKFTPPTGSVALRLRRRGTTARLEVTDSGKGIDPEFLPHIWERFRQADSSPSRQYGGLGLGLAVVRYLVEAHGGTVTAESAGAGRGSTFSVELPLVESPAATDQPAAERPDAHLLHGKRVLVVDDDPDSLVVIAAMLRQFGATVVSAESMDAALARLDGDGFDAMISDLAMPGGDGYALLGKTRIHFRGAEIPVIALSAMGGSDARARAVAAGFCEFLSKPVDPSTLAHAVADVTASQA